jgi:hydroxymethylpyrimidine pyrophosphatase-like HAD family hydrolase
LVKEEGINELPSYGERIENRANTQITLSILGQQAPSDVKNQYDPDKIKRLKMIAKIRPLLPEFEIAIGGSTSIDITKPGVNKAYGIRKLAESLEIDFSDIVYVGDDLKEGGNDFPARSTGVRCIETSGPAETLEIIKNLIEELDRA